MVSKTNKDGPLKVSKDKRISSRYFSLTVVDSCGKMEPGLFQAHIYDIGSKEQCLKVHASIDDMAIFGAYSLISINWPLIENNSEKLRFGDHWLAGLWKIKASLRAAPMTTAICYPSVCSVKEIDLVIKHFLKHDFEIEIKDEVLVDTDGTNVIWSLFIAYFLIVIFASMTNHNSDFLSHFDVQHNYKKLTDVKPSNNGSIQRLAFFNFFKVLGVIAGPIPHYFSVAATTRELFIRFFKLPEDSPMTFNLIFTPMVSNVSSNILTASILSVFGWHQVTQQRTKVKGHRVGIRFFEFSIMRILRSLPVLMFVIGLALVFPTIPGSGIVFEKGTATIASNCWKNGWLELIYMSNTLSNDIVSEFSNLPVS